MKKICFAVIAVATLAACKKDYKCTMIIDGESVVTVYTDLDKNQAETEGAVCKASGGFWTVRK